MVDAGAEPRCITVVFDPDATAQAALAATLRRDAAAGTRVRTVPFAAAIGRDLVEADRTVLLATRLLPALPHLRELLQRHRGRNLVLHGFEAGSTSPDELRWLRRCAGRVLAPGGADADRLRARLCVPVFAVARPDQLPAAVAVALAAPVADLDAVAVHLAEASVHARRGDADGAFAATARALFLDPDQPQQIADSARLLASAGRLPEATTICRTYLLQRPDNDVVRSALAELSTPR